MIIEAAHGRTIHKIKLTQNEAITVKFHSAMDGRSYLTIGVAKDLKLNPRV